MAVVTAETPEFYKQLEKHRTAGDVQTFYDKYADEYDKYLGSARLDKVNDYAANLLRDNLVISLNKPVEELEVLDVGCGTGMTGAGLKQAGFKNFDGCDQSEGMLKVSKEKNLFRNLFQGEITSETSLKCADNSYDGILCIGCVSEGHIHIKNALREFVRIVKPGGMFAYTIWDAHNTMDALSAHIPYFNEGKIDLHRIERTFYCKRDKEGNNSTCHVYVIKKL